MSLVVPFVAQRPDRPKVPVPGRAGCPGWMPISGTPAGYVEGVPKRRQTLAEIGYLNTRSMRTTFRALTFAIRWAAACAELGREPDSVDEFCAVLGEARRTAFRDQQAFREAYPTEATPLRIIEATGLRKSFEDLYRSIQGRDKALAKLAPMAFTLGASAAPAF